MTLSNKKAISRIKVATYFFLIAIFIDLTLSQLSGSISSLFEGHWIAIASLSSILLIQILNISLFSFEGEFEIIHIFSGRPFSKRAKERIEFPKQMVTKAEIKDGLLGKRMYLHLETNNGERIIGPFHLSFISSVKVNTLMNSLDIVSRQNKDSAPVSATSAA